jgi:hypothetical protein
MNKSFTATAVSSLLFLSIPAVFINSSSAQVTGSSITLGGSTVQVPVTNVTVDGVSTQKGRTENLSLNSGMRTSLVVGNTTSFGASSNLSTSEGLTALSRTVLVPTFVGISSSIGDTVDKKTTIDISNLAAKGNGGSVNPIDNVADGGEISIDENGRTTYASGNAYITGMGANVTLQIDPFGMSYLSSSAAESGLSAADLLPGLQETLQNSLAEDGTRLGEASFYATVFPNGRRMPGEVLDENGNPDPTYDYFEACSPGIGAQCATSINSKLTSGNASANANLTTSTNIDINSSDFVQSFGQAF